MPSTPKHSIAATPSAVTLHPHMITFVTEKDVTTQGLNNPLADETCATESTDIGVVVAAHKQIDNLDPAIVRQTPIQPSCTFRCHTSSSRTVHASRSGFSHAAKL